MLISEFCPHDPSHERRVVNAHSSGPDHINDFGSGDFSGVIEGLGQRKGHLIEGLTGIQSRPFKIAHVQFDIDH
jgi:hypothetical protein